MERTEITNKLGMWCSVNWGKIEIGRPQVTRLLPTNIFLHNNARGKMVYWSVALFVASNAGLERGPLCIVIRLSCSIYFVPLLGSFVVVEARWL